MKFNFKKITSVLASAVMLCSTMGIAAAATYPAPFIEGGTADVSVIVGAASPSGIDYAAASDVGVSLQAELAKQTATTDGTTEVTASGGDSVKIESTSNKLNMNNALKDVKSTKIIDSDMPNLLADETYRSKDNIDYKYEQYIEFIDYINWTQFADNNYKNKESTLGLHIAKGTKILNYTVDFVKDVRSDVDSNGRLEDMEDRDIVLLGETYKLLNAYNASSSTKFELMKGVTEDTINLNEEKTEAIGDKTYTVTLVFVDSDEVQFTIIDSEGTSQTTTKLTKGGTYKLADGTQVGVTDLSYQNFAGGVMSAEFTLGADKVTVEQGERLKINDEYVQDISCYIAKNNVDGDTEDIQKIVLEWIPQSEKFVTAEQSLSLPGLESLKLEAGKFTKKYEDVIKIETSGSYGIQLTVPIKDGNAKFDLFYGNETDFTDMGGDSDELINTGRNTSLEFTAWGNTRYIVWNGSLDECFFASWNSTTDAETYMLYVESVSEYSTENTNKTRVYKKWWDKDGNEKTEIVGDNVKQDDRIVLGSVELTIHDVWADSDGIVNISINDGGSFDKIYTEHGLMIQLPRNLSNALEGSSANVYGNFNESKASWKLFMIEENKDGNLGKEQVFNITLGHSSNKAAVTGVSARWSAGTGDAYKETYDDSSEYEGYVLSDLATRILYKQPTGSPNTAEVTYHGAESYANVFISAPEVTLSSEGTSGAGVTELGSVTYYDNELTSTAKAKNLIVVGGSCVNTVAAELLGGSLCTADFTAKTGVGADQFLVEVFDNPYATGKVAMLVAGYEAADTAKAVTYVTKESPATDIGTALKKVTATYADVE